jgi:hypothetical protein
MAKQLEITAEIEQSIKFSMDDEDLNVHNLAVFEAKMLSTEAISQKGFHDGARVSRGTLVEMEEFVNEKGTSVPLQIMHKTQGMLPVGKVFAAKVKEMPNGETELRGMFYIPKDSEEGSDLIKKIESALVDEVSVGLLAKKAICSECEFDYFGEEADFMNILTLTCENGHTIGENGTHVRLVGMDTFAELSLVGRGAAKDAKILSRAKSSQSLSQETVERLAASRIPAEAHVLTASFKLDNSETPNSNKEKSMNLETMLAETSTKLGKAEAELVQATTKIEGLNGEVTTLQESIAEKDAKIAELEASQDEDTKELKASNETLTTQLDSFKELLLPELKAAIVATGEDEDVPEDITAMFALIKEKGLKLHQLFGAEPTSDGGKTDVEKEAEKLSAQRRKSNFKIND